MKNNSPHHLTFEGAEMAGKSFLIAEIYKYLEKKYQTHDKILNGCHWFNSDVGVFGTPEGDQIINNYFQILKILKNKNTIFEKFHLSNAVYHNLYSGTKTNFKKIDHKLSRLNTKLILITVADKQVFADRLPDRINNTPHYKRIAQTPDDYIKQQQKYLEFFNQSKLEKIQVDFSDPLNQNFRQNAIDQILTFIHEK